MNLQELNQNGQHLSVFLTTAITTMLITTGLWFCFEQVNNYKTWTGEVQERRLENNSVRDYDRRSGRTYALATRVAMLVWLLQNGHKSWMQTSGAWWRVLVNDMTCVSHHQWNIMDLPEDQRDAIDGLTAGDYVTKFSAGKDPGFHPFDTSKEIALWGKGPQSIILRIFIRFFAQFFNIKSPRKAWRRRRKQPRDDDHFVTVYAQSMRSQEFGMRDLRNVPSVRSDVPSPIQQLNSRGSTLTSVEC